MIQTYKFLLISKPGEDADKIRKEIERNKLYQILHTETSQTTMDHLNNTKFDCLVYNLDSYTNPKIKLVTDLRELGHKFPIMMFAGHIDGTALTHLQKTDKNTVAIEKPFEPKDVWGICSKIVQGVRVSQRIHRRFYTNQKAVVEKSISGEVLSGQVFNMSRGGLYIELNHGRVRNGELVRLTIPLDKVNRTYNVDAEAVWTAPEGTWTRKPAVGFRFISAHDVYRNLLEKL